MYSQFALRVAVDSPAEGVVMLALAVILILASSFVAVSSLLFSVSCSDILWLRSLFDPAALECTGTVARDVFEYVS